MDKSIWLIWHDAYKEPPKESCYCYMDGDTNYLVYYDSRSKAFTVDDGWGSYYYICPETWCEVIINNTIFCDNGGN